ncbi:branched-chain amino acid transport system ATP-binding protein [Micromonospora pallida]|uniref:Branched-chain amino acid transport system ATP-binding protein n=1 Tax=Micromonospora pallida TaxID=145854 RepID=A0A1C6RSQ2_9ACTN|nr:ATP-binding cassette domain-containing protein [Micromonospora pallida]SCL20167.1 branched-chain amino acid transport system ATP-binding protein [Micromonospora pallida]
MSLLALHGVHKHYGGPPVVQDVTLAVEPGETVAIIGPNGAGKTTLFSVMAGERLADLGRVELFGKDVTRAGARRLAHAGVARTFQIARFFPSRTVEENVTIALQSTHRRYRRFWAGAPRPDDRVGRAIDATGLTDLRWVLASALSQGNRKNLEIAMALVQQPKLLLLDEPTAGMGMEDLPRTISILKDLRQARPDLAIVITAHDMDVVFALADRVVLLANGRIAIDGKPEEVRDAPQTREIYLGNSYRGGSA